jgi:tetratricopeptide (TPR) repeat protein
MVCIGLYLMVKDETDVLKQCIDSFKGVYDELVIVVGSNNSPEDTRKIARDYATTVIESEWINDYAYTRNIAMNAVKSDWQMWADADDEFRGDPIKLREFVEQCDQKNIGAIRINYVYSFEGNVPTGLGTRTRLHKKNAGKWVYKVHEVFLKNDDVADEYYPHAAYWHHSEVESKAVDYIAIMEKALNTCPPEDRERYYYALAREYRFLDKKEKAIDYFTKYVASPPYSDKKNGVYELSGCYLDSKMYDHARRAAFDAILLDPNYKYPYVIIGRTYFDEGMWEHAICWMKMSLDIDKNGWVLYLNGKNPDGSFDEQPEVTYLPWQYIGLSYWNLGRYEESREAFIHCLEWKPNDDYFQNAIKDLNKMIAGI